MSEVLANIDEEMIEAQTCEGGDRMAGAGDEVGPENPGGSAPVGAGSIPAGAGFAQSPASAAEGLSWCWELDLAAVIDAVTGSAPWLREPASDDGPPTRAAETPAADPAPACTPPAADSAPACASAAADAAPASDCLPVAGPDMEADAAVYREAVAAGRAREVPLELVAGRVRGWPAGWRRPARLTLRMARWRGLPRRSAGWRRGRRPGSWRRWPRSRHGRRGPTGGPRWTGPGGRTG